MEKRIMDTITGWIIELAVMLGLKQAGRVFPPLAAATTSYTILHKLDNTLRKQVYEDVKAANHLKDGIGNQLILIEEFNGFQGKPFLEQIIKKWGGGTAWYQMSDGRMECFWINDFKFKPQPGRGRKDGLGYVVHGSKNVAAVTPMEKKKP
jgi:hypothetical protein